MVTGNGDPDERAERLQRHGDELVSQLREIQDMFGTVARGLEVLLREQLREARERQDNVRQMRPPKDDQ